MSDIVDFGFEESKVIKPSGIERFKLGRPGEIARVSIVSFKNYSDIKIAQKAAEKGAPLTDNEKAEIITKIDAKLKEQLGKSDLTEVDRTDIRAPRFSFSFTHYDDRVGGLRCLSKYQGQNVVSREICCDKFGDAEQTIATVVMLYPVNRDGTIDLDYLKQKKNIDFQILRMTAKKFKKIESTYNDSRANDELVIDLKLTLDGEPKYQKFLIESGRTAAWARKDADPELRNWVIEQGIRYHKYVKNELGYEMSKEKLLEKLAAAGSQSTPETTSEKPKLQSGYGKLLED
jgi:hypothetical protein